MKWRPIIQTVVGAMIVYLLSLAGNWVFWVTMSTIGNNMTREDFNAWKPNSHDYFITGKKIRRKK